MIKKVLLSVLFFLLHILFTSCNNNTIDENERERRRIRFKIDSINVIANRKHWEKDYAGAIALYNESLELDNQHEATLSSLALVHYNNENYASSVRYYTRVIELLGEKTTGYYYLERGRAKFYLNDFAGALSDFDNYFSLNGERSNSYANAGMYRGIIYLNINRKADACREFSKAGESGIREAYEYISIYCK